MDTTEALERVLRLFVTYYNIKREDVEPPFTAEAEFHNRDEQFFLVKSAQTAAEESHEYVYFALAETLNVPTLLSLDECAWTRGLSRVEPHSSHRSSDIVLVIIADKIDAEALGAIRKLRHYKSYYWGFRGWSNYRLVAFELSTGQVTCNRLGQSLAKLVSNIK